MKVLLSSKDIKVRLQAEEAWLNTNEYVGGMTEWHQRRREHLLKQLQEAQMREWNL